MTDTYCIDYDDYLADDKDDYENEDDNGDDNVKQQRWWWFYVIISLPADVRWGSFVTHSLSRIHFSPADDVRGGEMNAWQTNPNGRLRGGYVIIQWVKTYIELFRRYPNAAISTKSIAL